MKKIFGNILLIIVVFFCASNVYAYTATEIANSVAGELGNMTDYTGNADVDINSTTVSDMTGASVFLKRTPGKPKVKTVMGSPYSATIKTDAVNYNIIAKTGDILKLPRAEGEGFVRTMFGTDLFDMKYLLEHEVWSKDTNTYTINSIACYRLYTSKSNRNYEVWIDEATRTKVIRVKATDSSDNLHWQVDYRNYSDVENMVMLPSTIDTKGYTDGILTTECTYTFSNIDINENISDFLFIIQETQLVS